jgi:hypothetical protein
MNRRGTKAALRGGSLVHMRRPRGGRAELSGELEPAPSRSAAATSYLLARSMRALIPLGVMAVSAACLSLTARSRSSEGGRLAKSTNRRIIFRSNECPVTKKPGAAILRWHD